MAEHSRLAACIHQAVVEGEEEEGEGEEGEGEEEGERSARSARSAASKREASPQAQNFQAVEVLGVLLLMLDAPLLSIVCKWPSPPSPRVVSRDPPDAPHVQCAHVPSS